MKSNTVRGRLGSVKLLIFSYIIYSFVLVPKYHSSSATFRDLQRYLSMAQNFDFWIDVWPLFLGFFEILKGIVLFPFPKSRRDLNGEVALITGAGSGKKIVGT